MSNESLFDIVPVVDSSLMMETSVRLPVLEGASSITSREIQASSATSNSWDFSIQPVAGTVLSNAPPILTAKFTVNVTASSALANTENVLMFGGNDTAGDKGSTGFSAYPLMEMFSNSIVSLDGGSVTEDLSRTWPLKKMLMKSHEEDKLCDLQPVAQDYYLNYGDYAKGAQNSVFCPWDLGANPKYSRAWYQGNPGTLVLTTNPVGDGANPKSGIFTVEMSTPLLINPFSLDEDNSGFSFRTPFRITLTLKQQHDFLRAVYGTATNLTINSISIANTSDVKLRVFYLTPPVSRPIANRNVKRFKQYTFVSTPVSFDNAGKMSGNLCPNVNLSVAPTRLICGVRKIPDYKSPMDSDHYVPVSSVSIMYDNQANLLSDCTVQQLFTMSKEAGLHESVDWSKYTGSLLKSSVVAGALAVVPTVASPVVLDFSKHIANRAFVSPNTISDINSQITVNCETNAVYANKTNYEVFACYEHDAIMVMQNGSCTVFSNGLITHQQNVDASTMTATVAPVSELKGGNFARRALFSMKREKKEAGMSKKNLADEIHKLKLKLDEMGTSGSGKASGKASGYDSNALFSKLRK